MTLNKISQPPNYYFRQYSCIATPQHFFYKHKIRIISSFLPVSHNESVLDCGCGSGVLLHILRQKTCQVFGVDKKIENLIFCLRLCQGGHFIAADLLGFKLNKRFDFVTCCDVIEHFNDLERNKVIDNLCSHLSSKGRLLISYPTKLYFILEPVLKKLRKLFYPPYIFDDDSNHSYVNGQGLINYLNSKNLSVDFKKKACLGLVEIIIARIND